MRALTAACFAATLAIWAGVTPAEARGAEPAAAPAPALIPAPTLEFATVDGHLIHAKDLAGKVVLLDFWATWCGPCRAALPQLDAIVRRYDPAKFTMISVSGDQTLATLRLFLEANPSPATQVWDGEGKLRRAYGVQGFPTYFVIDGKGRIAHQQIDWGSSAGAQLTKAIDEQIRLLGGAKPGTSVARR